MGYSVRARVIVGAGIVLAMVGFTAGAFLAIGPIAGRFDHPRTITIVCPESTSNGQVYANNCASN